MEVGEQAVWIGHPGPHVQVPDLEVVLAFEPLSHDRWRDRIARPRPVRNDELDTIQSVLPVRESLVEQDLRALDVDRRVRVAAVDAMIAHRAVMLVDQTVRNVAGVPGRYRGVERAKRRRGGAQAIKAGGNVCVSR
jgi:hypothetical protein